MITLSICRNTLLVTEGIPWGLTFTLHREAIVQAMVDSRPNPIQRAWAAVEAKRGMA